MQSMGFKGRIQFVDGSWMRLEDAVTPSHFAWDYTYEWRDSHKDKKELQQLIDAAIDQAKVAIQLSHYRYIGENYWESTNPNDYTFYEWHMLPEEVRYPQVDEEAIAAQVREQYAKPSPYAKVFQKALEVI